MVELCKVYIVSGLCPHLYDHYRKNNDILCFISFHAQFVTDGGRIFFKNDNRHYHIYLKKCDDGLHCQGCTLTADNSANYPTRCRDKQLV
jgi:hypothetical protein